MYINIFGVIVLVLDKVVFREEYIIVDRVLFYNDEGVNLLEGFYNFRCFCF